MKTLISKIFFLFYLVLSGFTSTASSYSIVYIHLGPSLPEYVFDSVKQSRLFNPRARIFVACDRCNVSKVSAALTNLNVVCVACQEFDFSDDHASFLQATKHKGFWRFASERFFYVEYVIKRYGLDDVFHLENDNLLYVDLGSLLPIFRDNYRGIGATFDNDDRCIPGFLYIKGVEPISKLNHLFATLAHAGLNDMQVLAQFKKTYPDFADNLPIVPDSYNRLYQLINAKREKTSQAENYSKNIKFFDSIFDAAAIGQYLGGVDPIHPNSRPGFINESCLFNPSHFTYEWRRDSLGRKIPFAKIGGQYHRINNLHIHCKDLKRFMS